MFNTADEELSSGGPAAASGGETQEDEGGDTEEWTRGTEGRGESAADNWFWFVTGRVRVCKNECARHVGALLIQTIGRRTTATKLLWSWELIDRVWETLNMWLGRTMTTMPTMLFQACLLEDKNFRTLYYFFSALSLNFPTLLAFSFSSHSDVFLRD